MSRLERFVATPLVSERRLTFMTEPVVTFHDIQLSRRELAADYEVISSASMTRLVRILDRYGITTPRRLAQVGMLGLAKCAGVGEACLWAASVLVEAGGEDVVAWIGREDRTFTNAIKRAVARVRGRKDPAPTAHAAYVERARAARRVSGARR